MRYSFFLLLLIGCASGYTMREQNTVYTCNRGDEMFTLRPTSTALRYFYDGVLDSIVTIRYMETIYHNGGHLVRPHATHDLRYDLRENHALVHKNVQIEVINATANSIMFRYFRN